MQHRCKGSGILEILTLAQSICIKERGVVSLPVIIFILILLKGNSSGHQKQMLQRFHDGE